MCRAIDAAGQAADHAPALLRQVARKGMGIAFAVGGGMAGADDRQHGACQQVEPAMGIQDRRRVVQCVQCARVRRVGQGQQMMVIRLQPVQCLFHGALDLR